MILKELYRHLYMQCQVDVYANVVSFLIALKFEIEYSISDNLSPLAPVVFVYDKSFLFLE